MNEKEAIIKLKTCNDKAAFAFLYRSYWAKVYNFTRLYITSAVDVEEIVQEVFIKIWENREALDEEQNFAGYLFITMRNLVFNRSRKNLNEPFYQLSVIEAVEESYDIEEELDAANLRTHISALISMLPPRQQEVFRLSRDEELSYREIAERLQISERTVEHHLRCPKVSTKKHQTLFTVPFIINEVALLFPVGTEQRRSSVFYEKRNFLS